ncbi:hypothetical protein D3C81_1168780 [compost metagenome]
MRRRQLFNNDMLNHRGILTLIGQHVIIFSLVFMKNIRIALHHMMTNRQHIIKIDQKPLPILLLESLVVLQNALGKRYANLHFRPFVPGDHFIFYEADICR